MIRCKSLWGFSSRLFTFLLAIALTLLLSASAHASADVSGGWGQWWLPPVHSEHGPAIDSLFVWTFWITMISFILVEVCLVFFLVKYRRRTDRKKAHFTHGNTRLEMTWTLAPAVILAALAVANKGVWDRLRFNPDADRADKATILVIGQQFKWNVIYPGPDGKLGRYLMWPKPTDTRWPGGITFEKVKGPADLKYDDAMKAIKNYADLENPLGKDLDDPDGKDDNWEKQPGRAINIPGPDKLGRTRPVEVQLSSKDVIHSFFLPNYRVKLDAVPGMRGRIVFTATMTSKQREESSRRKYNIDELLSTYASNPAAGFTVTLSDEFKTEGAEMYKPPRGVASLRYADKDKKTIARNGTLLDADHVKQLKDAGVKEIWAFESGNWELVCEELCGQGHSTMSAQLVVLDSDEYNKQFEGGRSLSAPATRPTNIAMK